MSFILVKRNSAPIDQTTEQTPSSTTQAITAENIIATLRIKAQGIVLEKARAYCRMGCSATSDKFEIIAAANLDQDEDLDLWTINERKEIVHTFDDLTP